MEAGGDISGLLEAAGIIGGLLEATGDISSLLEAGGGIRRLLEAVSYTGRHRGCRGASRRCRAPLRRRGSW